MQNFSYHTHTNFSDGCNSLEEMLEQAVALGWSKIGISDHLIIHKNVRQSPSFSLWQQSRNPAMYREDFDEAAAVFSAQRDRVRKIAEGYPIEVLFGAEVDFFGYSGWLDEFDKFYRKSGLDYCITGNHLLPLDGENILDMRQINLLDDAEKITAVKRHFQNIYQAVCSERFLFLAHFDYVRQTEICDTMDFWEEKMSVIEALQQHHVPTELSTKGLRRGTDYYPAAPLLQQMMQRRIPLILSDDAHAPEELGYHFTETEAYLAAKKYTVRFSGLK